MATGLAQGAWMLRQLASTVPGLGATTRPESWQHGGAQLLLAEAFITAAGKPEPLSAGQDAADAAAAGLVLTGVLDSSGPLTSTVRCALQDPFNLLAAAGWVSGWQSPRPGQSASTSESPQLNVWSFARTQMFR